MSSLPDYIVADLDNLEEIENSCLRKIAQPVTFPLTEEDVRDIKILIKKFDSENGKAAGISAPQIGISKRIIVFEIPKLVAHYRRCQAFPKTVWINPSYIKATEEMHNLYEQCYSVNEAFAPIIRHKSIVYEAYNMKGKLLRGRADTHTARVIQHEVDHLDGKLFIDHIPRESIMKHSDYMKQCSKLRVYKRRK